MQDHNVVTISWIRKLPNNGTVRINFVFVESGEGVGHISVSILLT